MVAYVEVHILHLFLPKRIPILCIHYHFISSQEPQGQFTLHGHNSITLSPQTLVYNEHATQF